MIGTSARVLSLCAGEGSVSLTVKGTEGVRTFTRLRVPFAIRSAEAKRRNGQSVGIDAAYDPQSRTVLLSYDGIAEALDITVLR